MSFVKMPQDDYVAMCNKLRSMLNETDKYTSKDFIEKMDELILPNLDDMYFGSNSSLPEKGNSNPQYYEDIAKAINEIKQADAVVLEELNVTKNRKYTAPSGIAYSSVNVDIEEGGNPNYMETIEGTLANPWGDIDPSELHQSVLSGDASVYLKIDATALGFGHVEISLSPFQDSLIYFTGIATSGSNVEGWMALALYYKLPGTFERARLLQNNTVTDMSQYATMLSTVLTVIHHPMNGVLSPAETQTFGGNA